MAKLNLGILAHVDAGKTTLSERLLFAAGVIDEIGRVDHGTTQTDSLALERQRGITIKSAVVSFVIDGVTVNLIDTPGHPDFIAEVERVLGVLDGAVLVISAVEGVQSQTLVLHRALQRLRVPTLIFVNKIDRQGADERRVLDMITERLTPQIVVMRDADGTEAITEALAANDEEILRGYVDGAPVPAAQLRTALADQTAALLLHPVYFGAAITGAGVDALMRGIAEYLPAAENDASFPPSGSVFKIERSADGDKLALVRMFSGTLRTRDRVRLRADAPTGDTVTGIEVFEAGGTRPRRETSAGDIARVRGLSTARIGDGFGTAAGARAPYTFSPPTLETAIVPRNPREKSALFSALVELAEQDPLINLRQDDTRQELFLSLYGEVQREVVAQMLTDDYGLAIEFRPVTPICVERPRGAGSAVEVIPEQRSSRRPFLATVGLAVVPRPPDSGVTFELEVGVRSIPLHVFDTVENFRDLMSRTVRESLHQGIHGWEVTDCAVTMYDCGYQAPPRRWPGTTLSDYRLLTPLVLMAALQQAGTIVCEPVLDVHLELPSDVLGPIFSTLVELGAQPRSPEVRGTTCALDAELRSARLHDLQSRLPDLTRGEGVLESSFAGYRPVRGAPPSRPRTDHNPLDRADYLRRLKGIALQ
ncbi:MAG TPA: translation factor GTPase family protein [Acidimicrobiia bacterium]